MDQNLNLDLIDNAGQSALYYACINRHEEIVDILIKHGATVIQDGGSLAKTLGTAGFEGDLELLKLLHKSEVNLNTKNFDGRTVGHLASSENKFNILKFLLDSTSFDFN